MADPAASAKLPLRLNHVEFAHRPGEGELAVALFEALGCSCRAVDAPPHGKYIVVRMDDTPHGENDMFASQAEPAQLALEDALLTRLSSDPELRAAAAEYRALQRDLPFRATHIGPRLPSSGVFDSVRHRLAELARTEFAGRLVLGGVTLRDIEEARATSAPLKQVWLWTDIVSTGLLTFGQQIELQAYEA